MAITDEQKNEIKRQYKERFDLDVTSVEDGNEPLLGGTIAIASYRPNTEDLVGDVVYIHPDGTPHVFETTKELITFLQRQNKSSVFYDFFESKMFQGVVFVLVIVFVFWGGFRGHDGFDERALTIFGSIAGLAAGLFFSPARK